MIVEDVEVHAQQEEYQQLNSFTNKLKKANLLGGMPYTDVVLAQNNIANTIVAQFFVADKQPLA